MSEQNQLSPEVIEQQNKQMRAVFMDNFNEQYNAVIKLLNKLPLNLTLRSYAYMNFDQAAMWAREAIASMQFAPTPVPAPQESAAVLDSAVEEPKEQAPSDAPQAPSE